MDCSKSDKLIMKYMDNTITKQEAQMLNEHLSKCDMCMEDFKVYDDIMAGFADIEVELNSIEITLGLGIDFEEKVMQKIAACGVEYAKISSKLESMISFIIGLFSIVFGLGFLIVINREAIMSSMGNNDMFSAYVKVLSPMVNVVETAKQEFTDILLIFINNVAGFVSKYNYFVLVALVALLLVQYIMDRKDKVEL